MEEVVNLGQLLHDSPDLFPWVCLAIILIVATAQHKRIFAYFDARIEAHGAKQKSDAVLAELIRNNTAALDNNTAALVSVKQDRGETRRLINYHERISKERIDAMRCTIEHVQSTIDRIDETVNSNSRDMKIITERTK